MLSWEDAEEMIDRANPSIGRAYCKRSSLFENKKRRKNMNSFLKGALGFIGCAGISAAAYQIGKSVGRENTLREIEQEERLISRHDMAPQEPIVQNDIVVVDPPVPEPVSQATVEKVRKMHGWKSAIFGGTSAIKDLLKNPDNKKLVLTVENGDVVARISQKEGGS